MVEIMSSFHFIRPLWLLMLIPVIITVLMCFNSQSFPTNWHRVINPKLINYLLIGKTKKISRWPLLLASLCWVIACIALAGPAWNKTTINPHKNNYPLVIALDLSPGILAADLSPNRLSRVSYKLQDLLKTREQGSNALVVYSGSAHAVTPLTDDNNTLINLIKTISPAVMPTIGNRPDSAIELAVNLLKQSGHTEADILLLTNEVSTEHKKKIKSILANTNIKLSIIGVGTEYGGPILLSDASYLKDTNNNVKLFKLQEQQLRNLAKETGGKYITMTVDNKDLTTILPKDKPLSKLNLQERNIDYWQDMGIWLVLLLLPFALFAFRWVCPALLLAALLPTNDSYALEWHDLWQTKDQQAQQAFNHGDYAKASSLFENPEWKSQALYAEGNYQQAAMANYKQPTAVDEFNRGNALAKAGDLGNAIISYDKSLELDPTLEDAKFNKEIVEKLLKQQDEQQKQQKEQQKNKQQSEQAKNSANKDNNKKSQQSEQSQKSQQGDSSQQQQQNAENNNQQSQQPQAQNNEQQQNANSQQAQNSQNDKQKPESSAPQNSQQQTAKESENNATEQQQSQGSGQNNNVNKPEDSADKPQQQQGAGSKADEPKQPDANQQKATAKGQQADAEQQQSANAQKQKITNNKPENSPEQQAVESWLRTIPDDPGGLLKRKFMHQYKQHHGS